MKCPKSVEAIRDTALAARYWPRASGFDTERKACMSSCVPPGSALTSYACTFYRQALLTLQAAQVPFLVGGAYALAHYTGITRHTKDVDIFVYLHKSKRNLEEL